MKTKITNKVLRATLQSLGFVEKKDVFTMKFDWDQEGEEVEIYAYLSEGISYKAVLINKRDEDADPFEEMYLSEFMLHYFE